MRKSFIAIQSFLFLALLVVFLPNANARGMTFHSIDLQTVDADKGLYLSTIHNENKPFNYVMIKSSQMVEGLSVNFDPEEDVSWEEVHELGHDDGTKDIQSIMFTSPVQSIQFKLEDFFADPNSLKLEVSFGYEEVRETQMVLEDRGLFAGEVALSTEPKIISRAEWGADEGLRVYVPDETPDDGDEENQGSVNVCGDLQESFPGEFKVAQVIETDSQGQLLTWPIEIADKISKIFVHHTVTVVKDLDGNGWFSTEDEEATVRAIYTYHTLSRGWGDIGYNYLIGPGGRIYEGRAGGDKVVGAHAACYNQGSVGIALIGNFSDQEPTQKAMDALNWLIAKKSDQYNINPAGFSPFRQEFSPNVMGHRDVRSTACPGEHLYAKLPEIREKAGDELNQYPSVSKLDYDAEFLGETEFLLAPGEKRQMTLEFRNEGTKAWQSPWLHVSYNRPDTYEGIKVLQPEPGKVFVAAKALQGRQIAPGETASFNITVGADYKAEEVTMKFSVVTGSYRLLNGATDLRFKSEAPDFSYEIIQTNLPYNQSLFQGEVTKDVFVTVKNTGNLLWQKEDILLQKSFPRFGNSVFSFNSSEPLVMGYLQEEKVAPGEAGNFAVQLKMPTDRVGTVQEGMGLIARGKHWLKEDSNKQLVARVKVEKPFYSIQLSPASGPSELLPGERATVSINLSNKGNLPLKPSLLNLELIGNGLPIFSRNIELRAEILPDETVTLSFPVQAPYQAGEYAFYIRANLNNQFLPGGFLKGSVKAQAPLLRASKKENQIITASKDKVSSVTLAFENTGNTVWRNNGEHPVYLSYVASGAPSSVYHTDWVNLMTPALLTQTEVKPGEVGEFTFNIQPLSGGQFQEHYRLTMKGAGPFAGIPFTYNFDVEGEVVDLPSSPIPNLPTSEQPIAEILTEPTDEFMEGNVETLTPPNWFRVRLHHNGDKTKDILTANTPFKVTNGSNQVLFSLQPGQEVTVEHIGNGVLQVSHGQETRNVSIARVIPEVGAVVQTSMDRKPGWTDQQNDNAFRGNMELRWLEDELVHINELRLEHDYLPGLAEVSDKAHPTKRKILAILARGYAYHYLQPQYIKFPGMPYHGSDSPATFQKYLGYNYEQRVPGFVQDVKDTAGMMVTYQGEPIKPPYFSVDDGQTKSAFEVWGWTDTPYLVSVPDPWCEGMTPAGHGVGLSGCGSEAQAQEGKSVEEIIKYYYQGVEVEKIY